MHEGSYHPYGPTRRKHIGAMMQRVTLETTLTMLRSFHSPFPLPFFCLCCAIVTVTLDHLSSNLTISPLLVSLRLQATDSPLPLILPPPTSSSFFHGPLPHKRQKVSLKKPLTRSPPSVTSQYLPLCHPRPRILHTLPPLPQQARR